MTISDILQKVAAGTDLTDDEKSFLADYKEPDVDAIANARSKKERLKLEKQIADQAEAMEALKEQLDEATGGGSEADKLRKQLEKAQAKAEATAQALEAQKSALAETQRKSALSKVSVPWMDGVPEQYREMVLSEAFADIDTEDLADSAVVSPIIEKIKTSNAALIGAGKGGGAGTGAGEGGATGDGKPKPAAIPKPGEWGKMPRDDVKKKIDAMWAEQPAEG